jgi:SAM-dependent methyltransferase
MRIRSALSRPARRAANALGLHLAPKSDYELLRRSYYSPIPDLDALPPDVWERPSSMAGIAFDTAAQIDWCERELGELVRELDAPRTGEADGGRFYFENQTYEYGDAEIAYAIVRRFRPRSVLELGSGFSTLALGLACLANEREGDPCRLVANDPYPRGVVDARAPGVTEVLGRPAQDVPLAEFEALEPGDVLFVDTTHVIKLGGDVNYVILEVLPRLRPGVLVHFHDIWLPDQYHRALTEVLGMHWNEQYLLQAFLIGNREFEVLFATHAVCARHPERFQALVPGYTGENYPSGFWLRRVAT